jgi:cytochrome c peroxidase
MRDIFSRMGFTDQEMVALLGAHAMGRCHTDRSGYWGPWTNAETTFSNEYFRLLVEERWSPKVTHNGKPWTGPDQFEDSTGTLMMLPVDIALLAEPAFKKHVLKYAKDEDAFFQVSYDIVVLCDIVYYVVLYFVEFLTHYIYIYVVCLHSCYY